MLDKIDRLCELNFVRESTCLRNLLRHGIKFREPTLYHIKWKT
jgi:hypothetical protein